jgi:hypothetical protein
MVKTGEATTIEEGRGFALGVTSSQVGLSSGSPDGEQLLEGQHFMQQPPNSTAKGPHDLI